MKTLKEIAADVRSRLKRAYPDCKISVTKEMTGYSGSITVSLVAAPFEVWGRGADKRDMRDGYMSVNHFHLGSQPITKEAKAFFKDALTFLELYHYDTSKPEIDYYNTNFYMRLSIGKPGKGFELLEKKKKSQILKPTKIEHKTFKGRKRRSVAEAILEKGFLS